MLCLEVGGPPAEDGLLPVAAPALHVVAPAVHLEQLMLDSMGQAYLRLQPRLRHLGLPLDSSPVLPRLKEVGHRTKSMGKK